MLLYIVVVACCNCLLFKLKCLTNFDIITLEIFNTDSIKLRVLGTLGSPLLKRLEE
jgi:hypothetical protein